jgi:hypothetical protein
MRLSGTPFVRRDQRLRECALGLSIALLLQAGFLLMLTQPVLRPVLPGHGMVRELVLVLPRLSRPKPVPRQSTVSPAKVTPPSPVSAPPSILSLPSVAPIAPIAPGAPSTDAIQGFGQAFE